MFWLEEHTGIVLIRVQCSPGSKGDSAPLTLYTGFDTAIFPNFRMDRVLSPLRLSKANKELYYRCRLFLLSLKRTNNTIFLSLTKQQTNSPVLDFIRTKWFVSLSSLQSMNVRFFDCLQLFHRRITLGKQKVSALGAFYQEFRICLFSRLFFQLWFRKSNKQYESSFSYRVENPCLVP